MKFSITSESLGALQNNFYFMNKTESNDLILPPFPPCKKGFSILKDGILIMVVSEFMEIKCSFIVFYMW